MCVPLVVDIGLVFVYSYPILHAPGDLAVAVQLYIDVLDEVAARLKQDDDEPDGEAPAPDAKPG